MLGRQEPPNALHQLGGNVPYIAVPRRGRMVGLADSDVELAALKYPGYAENFLNAPYPNRHDWRPGAPRQDNRPGPTSLQASISAAMSLRKDTENLTRAEELKRHPVGAQIDLAPAYRKSSEPAG